MRKIPTHSSSNIGPLLNSVLRVTLSIMKIQSILNQVRYLEASSLTGLRRARARLRSSKTDFTHKYFPIFVILLKIEGILGKKPYLWTKLSNSELIL